MLDGLRAFRSSLRTSDAASLRHPDSYFGEESGRSRRERFAECGRPVREHEAHASLA